MEPTHPNPTAPNRDPSAPPRAEIAGAKAFPPRTPSGFGRVVKRLSPAIIVMLALGLGCAGAVFAVLDGFLWRPLPYAHPHELVVIRERLLKTGLRGADVSYHAYHELVHKLPLIRAAGLVDITGGLADVGGIRHMVFGGRATPSLFRTLAVAPRLGRLFSRAAGRPGGPPQALLSYSFWKSAYGGTVHVIGQWLHFGDTRYEIVGVMPKRFYTLYTGADFWLSRALTPAEMQSHNINHTMIARLAPGTTLAELNAALAAYRNRMLARIAPVAREHAVAEGYTIDAAGLHHNLVSLYLGGHPEFLWILALIALALLVIAIANTVNLALVRSHQRAPDLAVRRAQGATTSNLARLVFGEWLLTVLLVTAGAIGFALLGTHLFQALIHSALTGPVNVRIPFLIRFGRTALAGTAAVAVLLVGIMFLAALLHTGRESLLPELLHEAGGHGTSRRARLLGRGFGSLQIVLATLLVMIGLLLTQNLLAILHRPLHFHPSHRLETLVIWPHNVNLDEFWKEASPALRSLSQVRSEAIGMMVPFNQLTSAHSVIHTPGPSRTSLYVNTFPISRGYFRTLGIPFLAGRTFTLAEEHGRAPVVILSEKLAQRLFHGRSALGRTFGRKHPLRIVGIVSGVAWQATPEKHVAGTLYLPLNYSNYRVNASNVILHVRTLSPALAQSIRTTLEQAVPGAAVTHLMALPAMVHASEQLFESLAEITSAIGFVALFLTIFGVYALTAQTSLNRRQEYAIRSALGATPASVGHLVLKEALWMLAWGLTIGFVLSFLLSQVLTSVLYGVGTINIPADLIGILVITGATLAASWIPVQNTFRAGLAGLLRPGAT